MILTGSPDRNVASVASTILAASSCVGFGNHLGPQPINALAQTIENMTFFMTSSLMVTMGNRFYPYMGKGG